jgi:hypothetical protein
VDSHTVLDDLSTVFLMMLDDEGKNGQQLHLAGVRQLLDELFTRFLEVGLSSAALAQDPSFPLVLALMWMTGSQCA